MRHQYSLRKGRPSTGQGAVLAAFLVFGILYVRNPLLAQQDVSYGETLDVRVVNLDVLVVGKKGETVQGLEREDFLVTEDGRSVEIQFFSAPGSLGGVASGAGDDREWAESEIPEAVMVPGPQLVVYLDDENLPGAARKRFLRDLRSLLSTWEPLPPTLLLQRRGGLPISSGTTSDVDELIAAIEGAGKPLARGLVNSIARRQTLQRLDGIIQGCLASNRAICTDCFGELLAEITSYAVAQSAKVERVASGILGAIGSMSSAQEQRTLLYVGDGLPQIPGLAMFSYLGDQCADRRSEVESEALRFKQERLYEELGAIANAGRISLYFYDAGGVRPSSRDVDPGGFPPSFENDSYFNQNQQAGMNKLAQATGGRALVNNNRALAPMETMASDMTARYSLGFVVDRKPTGRVHKLSVKLRSPEDKGRSVRYRQSFLDMTHEGRLVQQLNAAMYAGTVTEAFPVSVGVGEVEPLKGTRKRRVPVLIEIPESALTVLPGPPDGALRGQVRIAIASTDERDRLSGYRQRVIDLGEGGLVPTAAGSFSLVVGLEVPKGQRVIVVAVRDETTGETTLVRREVEIE